jgi:acyl carrier protein
MASHIRTEIIRLFNEVLTETGSQLDGELNDSAVLLESGLDSLGFAILVARIEDELGLDPFSASDEAFYPRTFGEFVGLYEGVA